MKNEQLATLIIFRISGDRAAIDSRGDDRRALANNPRSGTRLRVCFDHESESGLEVNKRAVFSLPGFGVHACEGYGVLRAGRDYGFIRPDTSAADQVAGQAKLPK